MAETQMPPFLFNFMNTPKRMRCTYTNYKGEVAVRTITVLGIWYGSTDWHKDEQFFIGGRDEETGLYRDFAMRDMKDVVRL